MAELNTPSRDGEFYRMPVAAATKIEAGQIVVLNSSGYAEPASAAVGKIAIGRCEETVDNSSGSAGDKTVLIRSGIFRWAVNGTMGRDSIGDVVYAAGAGSVKTNGTSTSAVGILRDIDADGAWIEVAPPLSSAGLLVANNLSDVGSVATARTNLGLGTGSDVAFNSVTTTSYVLVNGDLSVAGDAMIAGALEVGGIITGLRKIAATDSGGYTVSSKSDSGIVVRAGTDGDIVSLPDAAAENAGQIVTVINVASNGGALVSISPHSSDAIFGTIGANSASGTANKDWQNTKATAKKGDYTTLISDGISAWWIIGGVGIWVSES